MFEFHGWAVVQSTSGQSTWGSAGLCYPDDVALANELDEQLRSLGEFAQEHTRLFKTINGLTSLAVSGCVNHREPRVFHLFEWLAGHGTRSYGVLATRDDEDGDQSYDSSSHFRLFCLAIGRFGEIRETLEIPPNPLPPAPIWNE